VTANAGDALAIAWGQRIGKLVPNMEADLVVVERNNPNVHRNLIDATERHVQLVVVRGKAFYGTRALMRAAGAKGTNAITVAGERRAVLVKMPGNNDARLSWSGVKKALADVRADPKGAWEASLEAFAAWGGPLDDEDAPLAIFGDMPEGDLGLLGATGEIPDDLTIPPPDSLEHDAAFFAAVEANGDPILAELKSRYQ
jgi:5-methylthioadenosine/S-adenosylhomocysteine deaminase